MLELIEKLIREKLGDLDFQLLSGEARAHFSTNAAFTLALSLSKGGEKIPPLQTAEELKSFLEEKAPPGFFAKIEVVQPGFINFWLTPETIQAEFLKMIRAGESWGKTELKKTVVIDYSAPNIAKPMSVAHLRSTIIGQSLYHIFQFAGAKVIGDNHLGDWGKQFGILIVAYKETLKQNPEFKEPTIEDLMQLYVSYSGRAKENPVLNEAARAETVKLQQGDKNNLKLWQKFYKLSLKEFESVYKVLGVKFDYYLGESFYNPMLADLVESALKKGVARKSEGAVVIPLDEAGLPPYVIQKSDGAHLYSTTDLATLKYRIEKFKADLILYVVGNDQALHFNQLFGAARKMGLVEDEELVHVKFGLILSSDLKKLSTRAGRHISLLQVIDEAIKKAREVVGVKQPDLSEAEKEKIAKIVGLGALKYNDLSQNRMSDITFDWDRMLSLEGNSAPYLQYTYARFRSILRKAPKSLIPKRGLDPVALNKEVDLGLVLKLAYFPEIIKSVTVNYYPHYLANYLYELARLMNSFYEKEPVLKSEPALREARLALVKKTAETLKVGLDLLGIKTIEKI